MSTDAQPAVCRIGLQLTIFDGIVFGGDYCILNLILPGLPIGWAPGRWAPEKRIK